MDNEWGLIAGHHDGNQTLKEAMIREAKEEANIDIAPQDLQFVHALHKNENDERLEIFFRTEKWKGEAIIAEPHKAERAEWFAPDHLPDRTIDYIADVIKMLQKVNITVNTDLINHESACNSLLSPKKWADTDDLSS